LINVSVSSLKRYQSGERETPTMSRRACIFSRLVVGDLSGSYNDMASALVPAQAHAARRPRNRRRC